MTEYLNMWKNYVNFSDRTTVKGYWMAFLFNILAGFVLGLIFALLKLDFISYLYSLAVFIPGIAIAIRRLRDAGKHWANIFFAFIPLVGTILLIIFFCMPSAPDDGTPVV